MTLSTTISQQNWINLQLYARAHNVSISDAADAMLGLAAHTPPMDTFFAEWQQRLSCEELYQHLREHLEGLPVQLYPRERAE